jgi:hypothetical protein
MNDETKKKTDNECQCRLCEEVRETGMYKEWRLSSGYADAHDPLVGVPMQQVRIPGIVDAPIYSRHSDTCED